jgi:MFS family permease
MQTINPSQTCSVKGGTGSLLVGRPTDWWGRRKTLGSLAGLFLVSSIGCAGAWNWYAFLAKTL